LEGWRWKVEKSKPTDSHLEPEQSRDLEWGSDLDQHQIRNRQLIELADEILYIVQKSRRIQDLLVSAPDEVSE
jgi:hypothetical protein